MKIFFLLFVIFSIPAFSSTESKRMWIGATSNRVINEKYSFLVSGELRYNNDLGETAQSVFLLGPSYHLDNGHKMGLIYGHFHSPNRVEHRFTLQYQQKYGNAFNFSFSGMTRLEGRFLENDPDDSVRFRYRLTILEQTDRSYKFIFWNDIFLNLTDDSWTGNRTFERNRAFLGVRIPINETNLQVGYMNEYIPRTAEDQIEHIFALFYLL
ncbi:MAG: DUF2490 domain-containing protein [Halobacteriovoraceae bacterium]|nr:DUF2490 domain-containing protein [Halobacteriovoraceae bacterium]MCB9095327.1 DUF2490 domain-containing protein [Halobacteriovoraceae bacterium]